MFEQVKLTYGADALEPYIDTLTVETHYGKHHATYTKNFNDAVAKAGLEGKSAEEILASLDSVADESLRKALRNNGGGYYNHNLYFESFSPSPAKAPTGALLDKINEKFGSVDALKEELTKLATGQFGSGWAWLSANKAGDLMTSASPNQDNTISEGKGYIPIIALDVWEHAYYLKYKNLRPDYIKNFFEILDWSKVEENYKRIIG
ncbi:MAG: superoxide dismutase [Lachnospiraceae bacterium]|nr:superoxide dismutase [Lachnospiraceae bacterium]